MAPTPNQDTPRDKDKTASIQIDGEEYEVPRQNNLVADLIRLTGADPSVTDLVQVKGREQTTLKDDDRISVNSGSKFVTVSTEPTPVA
jgi:uncharacterized protein YabE (DUF348 family)